MQPGEEAMHKPSQTPRHLREGNFIPAKWFNGADVTALENEKMWPRTWHCAARIEEFPEIGDYVAFEMLDESILVVRTGEDEFKAYYNVCPHRGRRIKDEPRGNVRDGLYCGYHGWVMALDGGLKHVPDLDDWCQGALDEVKMKQARLDRWAGWIWVNLDPDAPDLREYLGPVVEILAPLELENCRRAWHATLRCPVNWKVQYQAFNEGYHSGATHDGWVDYRPLKSPATVHGDHAQFFSEWSGMTRKRDTFGNWQDLRDLREDIFTGCEHLYRNLKALVLEPTMNAARRLMSEVPADASPEEVYGAFWRFQKEETERAGGAWPETLTPENIAKMGTDWQIFPSTIVLPSVDGALWYRIMPSDDGTCCYHDIWCLGRFAPGEEPAITDLYFDDFESFTGANPFLEEDFANLIAVDKGMRSRGWDGAVLNPRQEPQQLAMMQAIRRYIEE
jgi:phenylpropionate dioxygenase-like ring-hydroxylating dioxygenase large terminal subunit